MKKQLLLALAFCAMWFAPQPSAKANTPMDFVLDNQTGAAITEVYVAPHGDSLGANWLIGPLPDGCNTTMRFFRTPNARYYDIRVVYPNGVYCDWTDFDLLSIKKITLYIDANGNPHAEMAL